MRVYNVDCDTASELFDKKQAGKCECCKKNNLDPNELHIDHNHKTNKVRGVVCRSCNAIFGRLENVPAHNNPQDWYKRIGKIHHLDWIVYRGYD